MGGKEWIIIIIILGLGLLFINEKESIISIIYFVSILIILIYLISTLDNGKYMYYTYIIIIVYLSALIILFAYVILLTNMSINKSSYITIIEEKKKKIITGISILIIGIILYKLNLLPMETISKIEINEIHLLNKESIYNKNILDILGKSIYLENKYILGLILVTILLLIALIGVLLIFS